MIPQTPEEGCLQGTLDYKYKDYNTWQVSQEPCTCEEHCAWERCHLVKPPDKCLDGTKGVWTWDADKRYWVAQEEMTGKRILTKIF